MWTEKEWGGRGRWPHREVSWAGLLVSAPSLGSAFDLLLQKQVFIISREGQACCDDSGLRIQSAPR